MLPEFLSTKQLSGGWNRAKLPPSGGDLYCFNKCTFVFSFVSNMYAICFSFLTCFDCYRLHSYNLCITIKRLNLKIEKLKLIQEPENVTVFIPQHMEEAVPCLCHTVAVHLQGNQACIIIRNFEWWEGRPMGDAQKPGFKK